MMDNTFIAIEKPTPKRRRIWITILLSIINPGLGFIYNGNLRGGIVLSIILFIAGILIISLLGFSSSIVLVFGAILLTIIIAIYLIIYNVKVTKKANLHGIPWISNTWRNTIIVGAIFLIAGELTDYIPILDNMKSYRIPSGTMENTLLVGDYLLADKSFSQMRLPLINISLPAISKPKPGDLVVFNHIEPNKPTVKYIKRCIAVGGQTIEIRDKQVFVDGKASPLPPLIKHEDENIIPYTSDKLWGKRDNLPLMKIPDGKIFVMGDNRDNSYDSRYWGFLDEKDLIGKARVICFSSDKGFKNIRWNRIGIKLDKSGFTKSDSTSISAN
jgi:signal peptidase I